MRILHLDPDTREDLYADVNPIFLDFVFLEALFNVVHDATTNPDHFWEACEDDFNATDSEGVFANSIELLMDILKEFDRADGEPVDSPDYCLWEYQSAVEEKLALAISSITAFNSRDLFMSVRAMLGDPALCKHVAVKATHLGNTVVLYLSGYPEQHL